MLLLTSCNNSTNGESSNTISPTDSFQSSKLPSTDEKPNDETTYSNEYFTAKNCSIWDKSNIYEVDESFIIRYTADEANLSSIKQFNLNTSLTINQGYNIVWYEKSISNSNIIITQRDYLEYGDNIYFVTITNSSSQVMALYVINMYVEYDSKFTSTEYCYFDFTKNNDGTGYSVRLKAVPLDTSIIKIPRIYKRLPVSKIESDGFTNLDKINAIFIPDSVIEIGNSAIPSFNSLVRYFEADSAPLGFSNGTSKTYFGVREKDIVIKDGIQYLIRANESIVTGYTLDLLNQVVIENNIEIDKKKHNVTRICDSAFYLCDILTTITIPNSIIEIGEDAFYMCSSLTTITIPNSVTSIGDEAFVGCDSLTSIIIPNSVTNIGWIAFGGCDSLTIYCERSNKPSGWDADWNYSDRPVYWYGQWHYENGKPVPNN